eukprot:c18018_g1_i1 orf=1074-3002(-)
MKIVTYNVNGLRARISSYGSLVAFLDSLHADIICLQETRLSRQELTSDIAVAEGYESFFSCTQTSKRGQIGYSGVATFCRVDGKLPCTSAVLPMAADEGFTGLLHCSRTGEIQGGNARVGCYEDMLSMNATSRQELLPLDREGRCLITHHGSFVVFNIYGPCVRCGDTERLLFKLKFFQALQCRWENLLRKGNRVIVVGDLNIAPYAIDCCDPGPNFDENLFRKWLRSMLKQEGGPFSDIFRTINPGRTEAYTCWSPASGAEEFNMGTRIDHILVAGPCLHMNVETANNNELPGCYHDFIECEVRDCDILDTFKRFKPGSLPRKGSRRNLKLDGSDHVPVFVLLKQQSPVEPHFVPPLAARFSPGFRGRQQSIVSLLHKRTCTGNDFEVESNAVGELSSLSKVPQDFGSLKVELRQVENFSFEISSKEEFYTHGCNTPPGNVSLETSINGSNHILSEFLHDNDETADKFVLTREITNLGKSFSKTISPQAGIKHELGNSSNGTCVARIPLELKKQPSKKSKLKEVQRASQSNLDTFLVPKLLKDRTCADGDTKSFDEAEKSQTEKPMVAVLEWKRILNLMAHNNPLCQGHGEPCAVRVVKKPGPNLGRGFYVCARAKGPTSNQEANCNHFEWVSSRMRKVLD